MSKSPPFPLRHSRIEDRHYHLMVDTVTDYAIFMLDPSGFIQTWNAGAKVLKGYEADEVIGRHFSIFYPPELLDSQWPEHELAIARKEGRYEEEGWRLRKSGTRFWANVVITKLIDTDGTLLGFCKITRDLSERQRQDELLRISEERFRLLVEGVSDYAIFMLDPSGFIISWNKGAEFAKGYAAAEILGKHFSVFYPADVVASGWPDQELRNAVKFGRFEDEGWRVRKDGSRFWANVIITALFDAKGIHRGFAKITRDLTERRRNEMLEEESRRIAVFIAMLAHELRNPLGPIASAIGILEKIKELDPRAKTARDVIARQSRHLTRLVDDLLDMSRISAGKIHIHNSLMSLDVAVDEALEMVAPAIQLQSHTVIVDRSIEPVWVHADKARLTQIVSNILHNATKFTPRSGEIHVATAIDGDQATIVVTDNGMGIDPARIPHLFERFWQFESDVNKTFGGLGLGLSLAQELAQLQNATITAHSTGVNGEGSRFEIRLPRIAAPITESRVPSTIKTILVVDDNRDSADVTALLLETIGFKARVVYSGTDAIAAVMQQRPDAVLLDIGLPDIDGNAVAQHLIANLPNPPPLIAVTGYGQAKDREQSLKSGFHAHLTKPVEAEKLEVMLKTLI